MTIQSLIFALLCVALCSCWRSSDIKVGGVGDDPAWISNAEARQVGERLIMDHYPQGQLVSEVGEGRTFTYRFSINGTLLEKAVIVDRKTGKAKFESPTP